MNGKRTPKPAPPIGKAVLRTRPARSSGGPAGRAPSWELLTAASELHRGPAQHLANALMRLRLCERFLVHDPSSVRPLLRQALACTQTAMNSVRGTIHALQNPHGETFSLANGLRAAVEHLRPRVEASFRLRIEKGTWPREIEAGLAVIGCEALTNAAMHAQARHITVNVRSRKSAVLLEVIDDGKGFDYAKLLRQRNPRKGLGLALIQEQVEKLGGRLSIQSHEAGGGTRIRAVVPTFRSPGPIAVENGLMPRMIRP